MSLADTLADRYDTELAQRGVALRDEFVEAARELERLLEPDQVERWAQLGVGLATQSLRSWEAAAEYFAVSPQVCSQVPFPIVQRWAGVAQRLTESSPLVAAAYMRATPAVLDQLPPDPDMDIGIQGENLPFQTIAQTDLDRWAEAGERLHQGNWKSIALTVLFFDLSAELLAALSIEQLNEFVDVLTLLADRSYQLATSCLEAAPALFQSLEFGDRQPFLQFANALARASWADTRLYFERGPELVRHIEMEQRGPFLTLAARVVQNSGRNGFPHFIETANALASVPMAEHATLVSMATALGRRSPIAAMAFLRSAPDALQRITTDQLAQWVEPGSRLLFEEGNIEGADAYFRMQSARSEQVLASLTARVELNDIHGLLRMYSKALTGASIAIRSTEDLVDKGIGWVTESMATTEGSAIFLPPFVGAYPDQPSNFQVYKVFTTHQTGRIEFGSFYYEFGVDGAYAPATVAERGATVRPPSHEALTDIQHFFDLFDERPLIAAIFTIVEDTRVDSAVAREYGGIRSWLRRMQSSEADKRPDVRQQGLRSAYVENLLRASLERPDTILWPRPLMESMDVGLAAMQVVEQPDATVQDSAEVAAALYDIAFALPSIKNPFDDEEWERPTGTPNEASMPTPGGGSQQQLDMPRGEEMPFEAPDQPEFRGDFKPELVQLLSRLKEQQDGQAGEGQQMSRDQVMDMLRNSSELAMPDPDTEGEVSGAMGALLENIEKEAAAKAKQQNQQDGDETGDGAEDNSDLPNEITWTYYDEWDFRASDYRPRWCRVGERKAEEGDLEFYEETLQRHHGLVVETRRQFELMRPESFRRIKRLEDGEEIDIDRTIEFVVDRRAGVGPLAQVYWRRNKVERDVAVAFLMDMSASTDEEVEKPRVQERPDGNFTGDPRNYFAWLAERRSRLIAETPKRIVDLEKESLVLITEALEAIGDSYGIYGFSGYGRDNVEFHVIKDLEERSGDKVRRRIDKIQPIRSTRMGPAIRHTIAKMQAFDAKAKILILVSDGRPQDHGYGRDRTEKEYAVHDTHQALIEAKRAGITPFLITVDKEGHDYMKEMCSDVGYEVVDDIEQLPRRLTTLYKVLSAD